MGGSADWKEKYGWASERKGKVRGVSSILFLDQGGDHMSVFTLW